MKAIIRHTNGTDFEISTGRFCPTTRKSKGGTTGTRIVIRRINDNRKTTILEGSLSYTILTRIIEEMPDDARKEFLSQFTA